jgi:hypothetical protein
MVEMYIYAYKTIILIQIMSRFGVNLAGSELGLIMIPCWRGDEPSSSIKGRLFLDPLDTC